MNPVTLITGANRGIGLALTSLYTKKGYKVIATCRNPSTELSSLAPGVQVISGVDVATEEGVRQLQKAIGDTKIDILLNNAGILDIEPPLGLQTLDENVSDVFESMRRQFEVNTLGPLRVTMALRKNLRPGSKLVVITSRMGSVEDNTSGGYYGYRASKAALNMVAKSLSHDLKEEGVAVGIVHPGMVKTEMTARYDQSGCISPEASAEGIAARVDELSLTNTGTFWHQNGQILPW